MPSAPPPPPPPSRPSSTAVPPPPPPATAASLPPTSSVTNPLAKPRKRVDARTAFAAFVQALEANLGADEQEIKGFACVASELAGVNVSQDLLGQLGQAYGPFVEAACQAYITSVPFVDLTTYPVAYELSRLLSPSVLPQYKYLLLAVVDRAFVLASPHPADPSFRSSINRRLEGVLGKRTPVVFHVQALERAIDPHLPQAITAAESGLGSMGKGIKLSGTSLRSLERVHDVKAVTIEEMESRFKEATEQQTEDVPKFMLDLVIARAYSPGDSARRASDIHIEPGPPDGNFVVRYRVDGRMIEMDSGPMTFYNNFSAAIKGLCTGMQVTDRGKLQDGRYCLKLLVEDRDSSGLLRDSREVKLDLRVVCLPQGSESGGDAPEKFVFRILDSSADRPPLIDLVGGDARIEKLLRDVLALPKGLILLTGPTGCGKTTTLSRFVLELARGNLYSVFTVEDPVEYEYAPEQGRVTQVQVDPARGITFANTLRALLRADPDIILVGELRDDETAQIATQAALTGHQVLSTLHTNDAIGSVSRLQDMGVPGYLLSETLVCVVSQRLLPRLCLECKEPVDVPAAARQHLPPELREAKFSHALGCPACRGLGYRGRVPVVDVFYVDDVARRMIASGASLLELREYNHKYSPGLPRRALDLAAAGVIDLPTALTVRDDVALES